MTWRAVLLNAICHTTSGGTPLRKHPEYFGGNIPWVKSGDLTDGDVVTTEERISDKGLQNSSAKIFPQGTVLIAMYGATVGKLGLLKIDAATNQAVCGITPSPEIERMFLFYFLLSRRQHLINTSTGGAQPNISQRVIKDLLVPLPPIDEQRRIVDVLTRAEGIVRLRREAEKKAAAIIPALFLDMFGDPDTNPKGFATTRLAEIADVVSGITKGRKLKGKATRPVPYLRVANVQAGFLNLSEIKEIEATEPEIESLLLQPGDIVLTEGGDFDKLGRGAQWRGELATCIHQNHVFRVRLKTGVAEPDYFEAFLQTVAAKNYFLSVAKRTTNLASINMTQLKHLPVVLPSIDAQRQFADRVMLAHSIISLHATGLAKAQATLTSILGRVFSNDIAVNRECDALEEAALVPEG